MVILTVEDLSKSFGVDPLFKDVNFGVQNTDKIGIIGANGAGKSTLLKILSGRLPPDSGRIAINREVRIEYLSQAPELNPELAAFDQVLLDGPKAFEVVQRYEAALVHLEANPHDEAAMERVSELGAEMDREGGWTIEAEAKGTLGNLGIHDQRQLIGTMSGGQRKRVALARALIRPAELLILDEPTNHLDIEAIAWLESHLASHRAAIVLVSHDRAFLRALTRQILWVDRGRTRRLDRGFAAFEDWRDKVFEEEAQQAHKLDRRIKSESVWAVEGSSGRRKRNMGRVRRLQDMREAAAARRGPTGTAAMALSAGPSSGRRVVEAEDLTHRFGDRLICRDFSIRVMRGDRVAFVGPNGAGKTTLIKLLTGDLQPDEGRVSLGTNLVPAVFDQARAALDPERSLWDTLTQDPGMSVSGASDQVLVRGRPKHVVGYLKEFLFDERQARGPVKALSGGERARLLLARIMARESNLLILDEPTNDLDVETLDLLQELVADYPGTVLLVSHDSDILDSTANQTVRGEGDGRWTVYAGGWSDMLTQAAAAEAPSDPRPAKTAPPTKPDPDAPRRDAKKLTFNQTRRLDALPAEMERLGEDIAKLETLLADPDLYAREPAKFDKATKALGARQKALADAEEEWLELEALREELEGQA